MKVQYFLGFANPNFKDPVRNNAGTSKRVQLTGPAGINSVNSSEKVSPLCFINAALLGTLLVYIKALAFMLTLLGFQAPSRHTQLYCGSNSFQASLTIHILPCWSPVSGHVWLDVHKLLVDLCSVVQEI